MARTDYTQFKICLHNQIKSLALVPQNREQDFGGLKGLSLEGTPTRSGSLEAFCKQKFLNSAAA